MFIDVYCLNCYMDILALAKFIRMYVDVWICSSFHFTHIVKPEAFKRWHTIPYVNILIQFSQSFKIVYLHSYCPFPIFL